MKKNNRYIRIIGLFLALMLGVNPAFALSLVQDSLIISRPDGGKIDKKHEVGATSVLENGEFGTFPDLTLTNMTGFGTFVPITASAVADAQAENADYAFRRYFNNNLLESFEFPPSYYGDARATPSHNLVKAFYAKNGYPVTDVRSGIDMKDPNFNMMQLYSALDNRFALNVYYQGSIFGDSGQALDMSEGGKDSPSSSENATRTGYYLSKFASKKSALLNPIQLLNSAHYNPLLRKSEVLLNFAEAANEAWDNPKAKGEGCLYSAYEIMKNIRSKAGGIVTDSYLDEIAQSKDSFRKLVQNERRLEFAFENHRYFDMPMSN